VRLKVASRKSDLARWQAVQVARAFEQLPEKPASEFIFKASLGDQDLDTPLANMGAKGVFTEDFYADLMEERCDLVVHSWKDLPVEARPDTTIAMTLSRADIRDLLLVPETAWNEALKTGKLAVLTSSPRRVYNLSQALAKLLPHSLKIEFVNVRGNLPTRLAKMKAQNSALVLAKAGLDRLLQAESEGFLGQELSVRALIQDCRFMVLPFSLNPPAAAQGALAVEVLKANAAVLQMCAQLNDEKAYLTVQQEREVLQSYGGGCHQKIGVAVLAREYGKIFSLRGLTDQGQVLRQWKIENPTPWTRALTRNAVFPLSAKDNTWFNRKALPLPEGLNANPALFVARAEALPETFMPAERQIIWTAGMRTWEKLAARGVWVHGSFDGLGENEDPGLTQLPGPLKWSKVSHLRGYTRPETELIATYQLVPRKNHPDLTGTTHFFWMSSTGFERARQLFPEQVNNGYNAAGPGSTFEHLLRLPDLKHPPKVFVGLEQFLNETLP
jgi:hydroxymethylbilane synthase